MPIIPDKKQHVTPYLTLDFSDGSVVFI